jgi:acyl-coenzyme A thioesterase PaaI-like protein
VATVHAGAAASGLHAWAHRNPGKFRHLLNWYPCFRGTGAKVTYIAPDWTEMRVKVPLSRRTKNYVGTIFGGSLYASVDPHFMFMLMHNLGPDYLVWDKAASIRFRRPGTSDLSAACRLPPGEAEAVKAALRTAEKVDRNYTVDLVDGRGEVCATVEKIVNVRRKLSSS